MGKAKTASKNNPAGREKAREITYEGKPAEPVKVISQERKYMAIQFKDGTLPLGRDGMPIPWKAIKG